MVGNEASVKMDSYQFLAGLLNAGPDANRSEDSQAGLPDISNNVGSVKCFLSALLPSLRRVLFLVLLWPLLWRLRLVCNLSVGFSPT